MSSYKRTTSFEITEIEIGKLRFNPKNPREHSRQQVRQIARSIEKFGFIGHIIIDASHNIVCGHGRVLAAQTLGIMRVPAVVVDHLSEAELKAYMIADNKLTENAKWNDKLLGELFLDLSALDLDFGLDITGFEPPQIDLLIQGLDLVEANRDDALPDVPAGPALSQPGDLWLLGRHRVLCGDALLVSSYDTLMNGQRAASVFTDPPYNVKIDGHVSGLGSVKHREFAMATGEMSPTEFTQFLQTVFALLVAHSLDGSIHYVCMDWRHMHELLNAGAHSFSELKNICVWVKDNGGMGSLYRSQHEMVAVFKNGTAAHRNNAQLGKHGRNRTNVWDYPSANTFSKQSEGGRLIELHPTVKPLQLVADALLDTTARGDIVLDSFLGSGTTLMAAEQVGRVCYGMELDTLYVDTIIRRWQARTGDQAVNAITGVTFDQMGADQNEATNA